MLDAVSGFGTELELWLRSLCFHLFCRRMRKNASLVTRESGLEFEDQPNFPVWTQIKFTLERICRPWVASFQKKLEVFPSQMQHQPKHCILSDSKVWRLLFVRNSKPLKTWHNVKAMINRYRDTRLYIFIFSDVVTVSVVSLHRRPA